MLSINIYFLFPNSASKIIRPILRSTPPRVVGMPVDCATLFFNPAMPKKRLHEKDNPLNNLIFYDFG